MLSADSKDKTMNETLDARESGQDALGPAPHIQQDPPGPNARAIIETDHRFSSTSNTRDYPLVVRRASGLVVEDVDGNRFLDFAAGIAVCATGHCHPKVVRAMQDQAANLIHICGSDFYYPAMARLVEKLATLAPGDGAKRVLLTNSGTEAVEATIKLSRLHTGRKWIIAFRGAFHGRTCGALSLTCSKARQKQGFGPLLPMVAHAPYGDVNYIEEVLFVQQMAPEEVAAVFVEPVLGEGGYVIPDPRFLTDLRAMCDRHGILLVCDEIQCGMGRTGKMFAVDHAGVVPDVLLLAKGLGSGMPIGAVVAREDVMDWPPGAQGSTFGGNPVSCAAALATIDLLESGLVEQSDRMGGKLVASLRTLADRHACLARPRSLGLMGGVDVVKPGTDEGDADLRADILQEAFRRGLILLGCGACGVRFCPPLVITEAELEAGLAVFDQAIATVTAS